MDRIMAIACALLLCFNDLVLKSACEEEKRKNIDFFFLVQISFIFVSCLIAHYVFKVQLATNTMSIVYGAIIGILAFISYRCIFKCLEYSDTAYNVTVYRLNFIIATCLSIVVLNEKFNMNKAFGILFCLLAVFAFTNFKSKKGNHAATGLRYSITSCILNGLINFFSKLAINNGVENFSLLFYRFVFMFIMVILLCSVKFKTNPVINFKDGYINRLGIFSGIIILVELLLFYTALSIGDVGVISPITQLSFVVTAVVLFVFKHEKFNLKKVSGIFFAVASVIVISMG